MFLESTSEDAGFDPRVALGTRASGTGLVCPLYELQVQIDGPALDMDLDQAGSRKAVNRLYLGPDCVSREGGFLA